MKAVEAKHLVRRNAVFGAVLLLFLLTSAAPVRADGPENRIPGGDPTVTITVTPSQNLVPNQQVQVTGSGFVSGGTIVGVFDICTTDVPPLCSQPFDDFLKGGGGGSFAANPQIPATFDPIGPVTNVDCRLVQCVLRASTGLHAASHFINFASGGTTTINVTTIEPGDQVLVGATGVTSANTSYRLRMGTQAANCHTSPLVLGGVVVSDSSSNIAAVQRSIPTNATSGVRWLCWVAVGDTNNHTTPVRITIL